MSALLRHDSLRARLRDATTGAHARVDAQLGAMRHPHDYRAYLRGMHGFMAAVEPGLQRYAGALGWTAPQWRADLAADLATVEAAPLPGAALPVHSADAALGLFYVVEGSALGARLLLRRAAALGFDATRGAAFLGRHVEAGTARWPSFLALLAAMEPRTDARQACDAAVAGFEAADHFFHRAQETMA